MGSEKSKGKEVKGIARRILLVLTVALVMAAMLAVMAAPTFAQSSHSQSQCAKQNAQQSKFVRGPAVPANCPIGP